ncbi:hypothetical protein OLMES_2640 [Oleiphilus messinensis]|uniref:Uncharacterized protein n=1 Tax=Oleiphilus messinensis TaxID=141451 RepID=A0A1Y0I8X4_9GAMM|nr:hypothetical protein [Oleiphilus messinensis]ARU56690.1 hypothetical protein OLMES_2640 [Oleiphilus messinensis]
MQSHFARTLALIVTVSALASPVTIAEQKKIPPLEVGNMDNIPTLLSRLDTRTITVSLKNGKEYTGRVARVTDHILHLDNLRGMEYFDAVITIEDVSGFVIRTQY